MIDHIRRGTRKAFVTASMIQLLLVFLLTTHALSPFSQIALFSLVFLFIITSGVIFVMAFAFQQWRAQESFLMVSTALLVIGMGAVLELFAQLLLLMGFLFMALILTNLFVITMAAQSRERKQTPLTSFFAKQGKQQGRQSKPARAAAGIAGDGISQAAFQEFMPLDDSGLSAHPASLQPDHFDTHLDITASEETYLQETPLQQQLLEEVKRPSKQALSKLPASKAPSKAAGKPSLEDIREVEREVELLREGATLEKAQTEMERMERMRNVQDGLQEARALDAAGRQIALAQQEKEAFDAVEVAKEAQDLEDAQRKIEQAQKRIVKAKVAHAQEQAHALEAASRQIEKFQKQASKAKVRDVAHQAQQLEKATKAVQRISSKEAKAALGKRIQEVRELEKATKAVANQQKKLTHRKNQDAMNQMKAMTDAFSQLNKAAMQAKQRKIIEQKRRQEKDLDALIKEAATATRKSPAKAKKSATKRAKNAHPKIPLGRKSPSRKYGSSRSSRKTR